MSAVPERLTQSIADRYRIERELGSGGMATVYLAQDLKHRRKVAIKVLNPEVTATIGRDRFLREIEIVAGLTHPHIMPLFDSGAVDGCFYYVMPYIEGESLRGLLQREKQLSLDETLHITREVASGLGHAHHHGLIHRDIKPENVLMSAGIALVADFGIARAVVADDRESLTTTGVVMGTPLYMSPEQATGRADLDARADLYSLACIMYEMLAGEPPFTGPNAMAVLSRHAFEAMPPLVTRRLGIPEGIEHVLEKALAKTPADRYATAARFAEALSAAMTGAPALATGPETAIPNNLPRQRTSFVGRDRELAECAQLLGETRLLTLTGFGGTGKTRLALKLAESVLESYADGVWFVDLAPLLPGSSVAEAVAMALDVPEEPGKNLEHTLSRYLGDKRMLLLLDNCEHVLEASGELVDALLAGGDELRVLATSREGLGIEGERPHVVPSFPVPIAERTRDLDAVGAAEAVRLFIERARVVHPEFALTEQNAAVVVDICRQLDGIPLAIELAAARVETLSVEEVRAKLDDRFRFLTGGKKTLPRHQTLRAAVQWSHDHLSVEEQRLFRQLSVFAGGWTLAAAAAVAADDADEFEVLEILTGLIHKSLVIVERVEIGSSRYRLLETLRQFGQDKLEESGEGEVARARHLAYFVAWVEERETISRGPQQGQWLVEVEREHENLLAALAFCRRAEGGAQPALRIAGAIGLYWWNRGLLGFGREQVAEALSLPGAEVETVARGRTLNAAGTLARLQGALVEARALHEASLAIHRSVNDRVGIMHALWNLGISCKGDPNFERACHEESLALARDLGDRDGAAACLNSLGTLEHDRSDYSAARVLYEEALVESRTGGTPRTSAVTLLNLAELTMQSGDPQGARRSLREGLSIIRDAGIRSLGAFGLEVAAALAGTTGDAARSARYYGAAGALYQKTASVRAPGDEWVQAPIMARVRETLGEKEFARYNAEGATLGFAVALADAIAWLEDAELASSRPVVN